MSVDYRSAWWSIYRCVLLLLDIRTIIIIIVIIILPYMCDVLRSAFLVYVPHSVSYAPQYCHGCFDRLAKKEGEECYEGPNVVILPYICTKKHIVLPKRYFACFIDYDDIPPLNGWQNISLHNALTRTPHCTAIRSSQKTRQDFRAEGCLV